MSWDWVIGLLIIVGFILTIWAKVSKQSIPELLRNLREILVETKEGGEEFIEVYD